MRIVKTPNAMQKDPRNMDQKNQNPKNKAPLCRVGKTAQMYHSRDENLFNRSKWEQNRVIMAQNLTLAQKLRNPHIA